MSKNGTLREHRERLARSLYAYDYELRDPHIHRLVGTLWNAVRKSGPKIQKSKALPHLKELVQMLFEAQEKRPFFHVEGTELPLCWNHPHDWGLNYIKYEWGHLHSLNQSPQHDNRLENLGLYSARCNQHIQTSLNVEEVMVYGGIMANRISSVLSARRKSFESDRWREHAQYLEPDA